MNSLWEKVPLLISIVRYLHDYPLVIIKTRNIISLKGWLNIFYQIKISRKDKALIELKNGSKGYCDLECILKFIEFVVFNYESNIPMGLTKLHFKDGKLYYDDNQVVTDTKFTLWFSLSGWIREENGTWYDPKIKIRILYPTFTFYETFYTNVYCIYSVRDREVVDIGANVGGTPIYFALKSARKVYAFEPLPSIYGIALKNVELNNMKDRVVLFNAGVGSKDGKIKVPMNMSVDESIGFSTLSSDKGEVKVPIYSLERIVNEIIKDHYLLKMDCEGCKADIILNTKPEVLSRFEKIIFEYHHYFPSWVKVGKPRTRLRELGYKCRLRVEIIDRAKQDVDTVVYCEK
ncbi:FkbM family methyltransferase [Acidianus sulfidivorans JP7]|uniref:FkbM family methyltransferase n=1 Tax=Acidianus sulfidivorans JP7 TaxID=619593 RepID=A0A2U9IJM8_9CREN|nr:FkbM family methyltransferase [Acidianus sulfidivorans]AWR96249.1 FkbM family methyltransferase [Acidianus sulfidivorans JP7]